MWSHMSDYKNKESLCHHSSLNVQEVYPKSKARRRESGCLRLLAKARCPQAEIRAELREIHWIHAVTEDEAEELRDSAPYLQCRISLNYYGGSCESWEKIFPWLIRLSQQPGLLLWRGPRLRQHCRTERDKITGSVGMES